MKRVIRPKFGVNSGGCAGLHCLFLLVVAGCGRTPGPGEEPPTTAEPEALSPQVLRGVSDALQPIAECDLTKAPSCKRTLPLLPVALGQHRLLEPGVMRSSSTHCGEIGLVVTPPAGVETSPIRFHFFYELGSTRETRPRVRVTSTKPIPTCSLHAYYFVIQPAYERDEVEIVGPDGKLGKGVFVDLADRIIVDVIFEEGSRLLAEFRPVVASVE